MILVARHAHLQLNPSSVVAECDLECAFNMFDRAIIWEQLRKVPGLSGILPYVAAVYGVEATIVLERGDLASPKSHRRRRRRLAGRDHRRVAGGH